MNVCYRCGGKDHQSRSYRTQKYLAELYQHSIKQKGNKVGKNMVYEVRKDDFDFGDASHIDLANFLMKNIKSD